MTLTIGSLFSGIGGLELGLEMSGNMETVWQVENNPHCQRILAKHWPDTTRHGDIRSTGKHNLAPVDVICGGFPCQDISYAGKGKGLTGSRSGLWKEYARIIGELGPRYVVVENVPALLTRGIDAVLGTLADLGYDAEWQTISAADVGAPHLRKRIFILAYTSGERRLGNQWIRPPRKEGLSNRYPAERSSLLGDAARGRREQHHEGVGIHEQPLPRHLPLVDAEGGGRGAGRRIPARRTDGGRPELGNTDPSAARRERGEIRGAEADPQREGRIEHRGGSDGPADAGDELDDTNGTRHDGKVRQPESKARNEARMLLSGAGREELGHTDRAGLEQQRQAQPVGQELGPTQRRGAKVRAWADATPVRGADGTLRLIPKAAAEAGPQSPLWPVADGIPGRVARLAAIGNAVVPQAAERVGRRIHQLEEQLNAAVHEELHR